LKDEKDHIDKLFQDQLDNRSFEMPAAFLKDMEGQLDVRKPKFGLWRGLSSILFVAGLMAGTYLFFTHDKSNTSPESQIATSQNSDLQSNSWSGSPKKEENIAQNNGSTSSTNLEVKANDSKQVTPALTQQKKDEKSTKATGQKNSTGTSIKKTESKLSNLVVKQENNSRIKNVDSAQENKLKTSKADFNQAFKKKTSTGNFQNDNTKGFQSDNNNLTTRDDFQSSNEKTNPVDTLKQPRRAIRDSVVVRDSIVFRDSVVVRDSIVIQYTNSKNKDKNSASNLTFEGQAYVGFARVQPKIVSPFESYKTDLKAGEKKVMSPDFGFNLNAYYKNWTIGSGLKYYQFGEKTNYSTLKINQSIGSIDTSTTVVFIDSNGLPWNPQSGIPPFDSTVTVTLDTSYVIDSSSSSKSWQNSYTRFVIPLNFGYRFDYKNWSLIPRAGLNFEFTTTRQKGIYVDALKQEFIELEQRRSGMSYQLSLELRKSFGNWHVFINPYYRNNIGYVINSNDLKRKYGGLGTTFGVGIQF